MQEEEDINSFLSVYYGRNRGPLVYAAGHVYGRRSMQSAPDMQPAVSHDLPADRLRLFYAVVHVPAFEQARVSELLLDAKKLVVFRDTLRA